MAALSTAIRSVFRDPSLLLGLARNGIIPIIEQSAGRLFPERGERGGGA